MDISRPILENLKLEKVNAMENSVETDRNT